MQTLQRGGLSADEVRALLVDDSITPTWGCDLLDAEDRKIGDLRPSALRVDRANYKPVAGAVDLTVDEALEWGAVRVRPWQAFGPARFDLGVFSLATPENAAESGVYQVQGFDRIQDLQNVHPDTVWFDAGTPGLDVLRQVIDLADIPAEVVVDPWAAGVTLAAPMVWAFAAAAPTSYLRMGNDVAADLNYRALWADERGRIRADRYVAPAQRLPEWRFDVADPRTNIVLPARSHTVDNWQRVNWWKFVRSGGMTAPTLGDGIYIVDRSGGGRQVREVYEFDATTHESLVSQGDRQVLTDTSKTELVEITTGPLPCLGHFDVVEYVDPALGVLVKAQVRSWSQDLPAHTSKLTLEVLGVLGG